MCLIEHLWFLVTSLLMETIRESTKVGSPPAMLVWKFACSCLCRPFPLYMLIFEIVYQPMCIQTLVRQRRLCGGICVWMGVYVCLGSFSITAGWQTVSGLPGKWCFHLWHSLLFSLVLSITLYRCPLLLPLTSMRINTDTPLCPQHPDLGLSCGGR